MSDFSLPSSFSPASSLLQRARTTKKGVEGLGEGTEVEEEEEDGGGQEGARREREAETLAKEKANKEDQLEEQEGSRTMGTSKKTLRKSILLLVNK